jgi:hypothetical protein
MAGTVMSLLGCYAMYFDKTAACISRVKEMNKFVGRTFLQNMAIHQTSWQYISEDNSLCAVIASFCNMWSFL